MTEAERKPRIEAELLRIGIKNEADLREAIRKLPALNIGIMTDPIKHKARKGAGIYGGYGRQQNICG